MTDDIIILIIFILIIFRIFRSILLDESVIGLYFWSLFFGYYIFGILHQNNTDPSYASHFSDYRFITNELYEKSLIFVALFVIFFNINLKRFSSNLGTEKVANIALCVFVLIVPLTIFDYYARMEIVSKDGYLGLYLNHQTNIAWNFFLKYLPQILIFIFLASNNLPRKHIIFAFFLIVFIIQLLMTGQRTTPVLLLIINAVVYSDMYLNYKKRIFFNGSILVLVVSFALAGLVVRGGSIADVFGTFRGFSKPYDEILVTLISFENYPFLFKFDFSPLFPSYSYFCDFGSLLVRNNLCLSELRFQFQGMQADWLSLTENFLMYLGGGTSGGGFIASLLTLTLISQNNIVGYIFFSLIVLSIAHILNSLSLTFGTFMNGAHNLWIFRFIQLYLWNCILFSISGSVSSLVFGSRMILYSVFTIFLCAMISKIISRNFAKNSFKL